MGTYLTKGVDSDEIRRWHQVFKRKDELFEIRLLGDKVFSGYFDDIETAIAEVVKFDRYNQYQVYFTVNEVNPACSSRKQYNTFLISKGTSTSKNDIIHRWWMPIDIDVKRPTDISSTDEEKAYAHRKAGEVYKFLRKCSFPEPVVCDSSSGYHLYYPIDLGNDTASENIVHGCFSVLSARFSDDRVKIDKAVMDANRIMRLPGTWGRKGRDTDERPHRMAKILSAPSVVVRCDTAFLSGFIERYKVVEERQNTPWNGNSFNLRDFISEHGLRVRNEVPYDNGGTKFVLEECPFDPNHKAPDSALFLSASGAIGFKCFHDSCSHHNWHELRQMLDPTAYQAERQDWHTDRRQSTAQLPTDKNVVLGENPDLGKKWLSLTDIEDEDIDDIPRISTGFTEIDNALGGGLYFGDTTLFSGINGSGKSSWLNTLLLNSIQGGFRTALWTGELPSKQIKRWIVQVAAGKNYVLKSLKSKKGYYTPKPVKDKISLWTKGKFFLHNDNYPPKIFQLMEDMKELLPFGVKLFILDNLFSMDLDDIIGDDNAKQKKVIMSRVDFSKKNGVHLLLVAHPRKVVTFLRREDILGSSALGNAVNNIFIIHRTGTDFFNRGEQVFGKRIHNFHSVGNVIEICKNREFGAMDELCGIQYCSQSRRFYDDYTPVANYGWEDDDAREHYWHTPIIEVKTGEDTAGDKQQYSIDQYSPESKVLPFEQSENDTPPF